MKDSQVFTLRWNSHSWGNCVENTVVPKRMETGDLFQQQLSFTSCFALLNLHKHVSRSTPHPNQTSLLGRWQRAWWARGVETPVALSTVLSLPQTCRSVTGLVSMGTLLRSSTCIHIILVSILIRVPLILHGKYKNSDSCPHAPWKVIPITVALSNM